MTDLPEHPAAALFPLMDDARFASLVESIRSPRGLIHPIVLCDGAILDGRNRYRACIQAGVEPRFTTYDGDDPVAHSWKLNAERRDLPNGQRAAIWLEAVGRSGELRRLVDRVEAEANRKRSEKAKAGKVGRASAKAKKDATFSDPTTSGATKPHSKAGAEALAEASGTDRGSIERQSKLREDRPDLAEKVRAGVLKETAAMRLLKKDQVAAKVQALPEGQFRVIYADPPWAYNDTREGLGGGDGTVDRASTAASDHYPTMSKADLCALDVKGLAAPDAVLFCWATFPLLDDQLEVVAAWGFTYKTAFVWAKPQGSFGHYHKADAELLLVCTRGSCTPDSDHRDSQVQALPRGAHSAKPEGFRSLIDGMYPHGPRVELFRRGPAPVGWVTWGAEIEPEVAA